MTDSSVDSWRKIIIGDDKSWVLFEHGTCVILMHPVEDLGRQAIELMKAWGPVHAGSPAGDFSIVKLSQYPGSAVICHHPDILNYVSPGEVDPGASDVTIGLLGRAKRQQDAEGLVITHVEDRRAI